MSERVVVAIIAGTVAVVVSVLTSALTYRFARRKFELETSEKWRERLYELRLEHYPTAFELTGRLIFRKGQRSSAEEIQEIMDRLRTWWVGPAAALLSKPSVSAYYELEGHLKAASQCGLKGSLVNEIFGASKRFRLCLKKDLDVIFPGASRQRSA